MSPLPLYKEIQMRIPLLVPAMPTAEEVLPWLKKIDANRWYTNYGPLNARFEQELLSRIEGSEGIALTTVANCTVGLELILSELGLSPGARVLIPAITFVATGTAVLRAGFVPVIADVDADSWLLTPEIARQALEHGPLAAVMPVATFGRAQDVDAWDAFTRSTGVPVVIDAAGAFGNQGVGQTTSAVYSLHATKSLGAGEGGFIASRSKDLIQRIRRATNFGIDLGSPIGNASGGTNAKLSEYHAAVGLAALPGWERSKAVRDGLRWLYMAELAQRRLRVQYQSCPEDQLHTLFILRLSGCHDIDRVMGVLGARGIGSRLWYCPPLTHHTAFSTCPVAGPLATSEQLGCQLLGLPFYPGLSKAEVLDVADGLAEALGPCLCID